MRFQLTVFVCLPVVLTLFATGCNCFDTGRVCSPELLSSDCASSNRLVTPLTIRNEACRETADECRPCSTRRQRLGLLDRLRMAKANGCQSASASCGADHQSCETASSGYGVLTSSDQDNGSARSNTTRNEASILSQVSPTSAHARSPKVEFRNTKPTANQTQPVHEQEQALSIAPVTEPVSMNRSRSKAESESTEFLLPRTEQRSNSRSSSEIVSRQSDESDNRNRFEPPVSRTSSPTIRFDQKSKSRVDESGSMNTELDQLRKRLQELQRLEDAAGLLDQNSLAPGAQTHPSAQVPESGKAATENVDAFKPEVAVQPATTETAAKSNVQGKTETEKSDVKDIATTQTDKTSLFLNSEMASTPADNAASAQPIDSQPAKDSGSIQAKKVVKRQAETTGSIDGEITMVQNEIAQDIPSARKPKTPELNVTTVPAQPLANHNLADSTRVEEESIPASTDEQPLVLRAIPSSNHRLISNYIHHNSKQANRNAVSAAPSRTQSVPAKRASFLPPPRQSEQRPKMTNVSSLSKMETEFRSLPNIKLPRLNRTGFVPTPNLNLREQPSDESTQKKLLDIQEIVKYEIDRRIQAGQLVVPTEDMLPKEPMMPVSESVPVPNTNTTSKGALNQSRTSQPHWHQTDNRGVNERVGTTPSQMTSSDQASVKSFAGQAEVIGPNLALPVRKPGVPIGQFEVSAFDLSEEPTTAIGAESKPNLFVPVLSIDERGTDFSRPEVGTINLRVRSQPIPPEIHRPESPYETAAEVWQLPAHTTPIPTIQTESRRISPEQQQMPNLVRAAESPQEEILRLRAVATPGYHDSAHPIVRFRKISNNYRYINPDDAPGKKARILRPGSEEQKIQTIQAAPVYQNDELIREIRGLSELPIQESPATIKIIDR